MRLVALHRFQERHPRAGRLRLVAAGRRFRGPRRSAALRAPHAGSQRWVSGSMCNSAWQQGQVTLMSGVFFAMLPVYTDLHEEATNMFKEFKTFIMRGNVLDLAIGVIIGGAFGKIVASLVGDILNPVIGLALGKIDFSNLFVALNGQNLRHHRGRQESRRAHPQLRPLYQHRHRVRDCGLRDLSHHQAGEPVPSPRRRRPPGHQGMPRVPEHHPGRRQALRAVRFGSGLTKAVGVRPQPFL